MDDRQKLAAAALAEGKIVTEAANACGRSPKTIYKWLGDPEFQATIIHGIRGLAILTLAQCLKHGHDPKSGQAALATLRWLGVGGKAPRPRKDPNERLGEDEDTDLGEFSEESLRRLRGAE